MVSGESLSRNRFSVVRKELQRLVADMHREFQARISWCGHEDFVEGIVLSILSMGKPSLEWLQGTKLDKLISYPRDTEIFK